MFGSAVDQGFGGTVPRAAETALEEGLSMKDATTDVVDGDDPEEARVRARHSLDLMGKAPEERFDRITRIARELFDVPVAAVNLLDERELFIKSPGVAGPRTMNRADTFCDVTISSPDLLVVEDATKDSQFASIPRSRAAGAYVSTLADH